MVNNLLLAWSKSRTVYAICRNKHGKAWNNDTKGWEEYREDHRDKYKTPYTYKGGDIHCLEKIPLSFHCLLIYEQAGRVADEYDKVIAVFGDVIFDPELFPEKHRPYEPGPPRIRK